MTIWVPHRPLYKPGRAMSSSLLTPTIVAVAKKRAEFRNEVRQFVVQPVRHSSGRSHAAIWNAERALSVFLLGVVPVGIMYPSQVGDTLIAVGVVMHQHWGLEAIVTDYVRPILFGNMVPKLMHGLLLAVSAVTLGGLLYFNYNDIGITSFIRKIWMTKPKNK